MADILDYFGFDPVLGYRYRPTSGEVQRPQQSGLYRFQDGQPQPYQAPTGDPYDALREYTGAADLQSAFRAAGEGNYPAAAGYGALGTAGMAASLPLGAIGLAAKSARRGGDVLSALSGKSPWILPAYQETASPSRVFAGITHQGIELPEGLNTTQVTEGFLNNKGQFLNRQRAYNYADKHDLMEIPSGWKGAELWSEAQLKIPPEAHSYLEWQAGRGTDALSALDAAITKTRSAKEFAANAAEPRFPQFADVYPQNLPPNIKLKEKQKVEGGTETFKSRQLSPEGQALMDERARIQKDMDTYGYEPYYKPQEREYVDPSKYPPANVDTSTLAPSKWDTISNYMTAVGAPETLRALQAAVAKGGTLGDTAHWYAMAQHEASFTKELGPEAGRAAFLDRYAVPLAATTSGNAPRENFMLGQYLEHLRQTGQPYPGHSSEMPAPIYGQYLGNNLDDYLRMRGIDPKTRQPIEGAPTGYDYLGANQPKMHNFARSQIGDLTQPVMDKQMSVGMLAHAPGYADKVRTSGYGLIQAPLVAEAERVAPDIEKTNWLLPNMAPRSFQPGNLQDVGWAGFGNKTGKPMIMEINDAIERTHRLTGRPREEIVRLGLVRQQIPIYGAAGLTLGGLGGLGGYE